MLLGRLPVEPAPEGKDEQGNERDAEYTEEKVNSLKAERILLYHVRRIGLHEGENHGLQRIEGSMHQIGPEGSAMRHQGKKNSRHQGSRQQMSHRSPYPLSLSAEQTVDKEEKAFGKGSPTREHVIQQKY